MMEVKQNSKITRALMSLEFKKFYKEIDLRVLHDHVNGLDELNQHLSDYLGIDSEGGELAVGSFAEATECADPQGQILAIRAKLRKIRSGIIELAKPKHNA